MLIPKLAVRALIRDFVDERLGGWSNVD